MVCSGFVYAFAFDGFKVETATGGEVEAWLAAAGGGGSGGDDPDPVLCDCLSNFMTYDGCSTDLCESDGACGNKKAYCSGDCAQKGTGGCSTCSIYTDSEGTHNLNCANEGDLCGETPEACSPGGDHNDEGKDVPRPD